MYGQYSLAAVAALVGEPTRAALLLSLLDGRSLPAGELARAVRLSAAATSLHLGKLTRGGLLSVRQEGRHRYYRLASAEVAHALEALGVIATAPVAVQVLSPERRALRTARTCYDHLAGSLAVELATALERAQLILPRDDAHYQISAAGVTWFEQTWRIDVALLARGRRQLARRCLDWTERRPHLAGALGAALFERLTTARWLTRTPRSRTVSVTPRGQLGLSRLFGSDTQVRTTSQVR
jgi:DNA-binding transcriptional ArsR family regulator